MKSLSPGQRAVAIWIFTGVIMLLVQVVLGGITRLTGSGLSITEWNVVTGSIPPLSEAKWLLEFEKYKATPQYQLLNTDFNLSDFKFIYFWEWLHRFWARLIGIVFIVGFIYLVSKRYLKKGMEKPLLILFLLGALQGAIGWIMVASGLTGDAIYVKPTRLALHFVFALGLIAYAWWFALQLSIPEQERIQLPGVKKWTWALVILLFFQLVYGALMAGYRAAAVAPTWPDMNGEMVPYGLSRLNPPVLNLFENTLTIQFIHRSLAYLLVIATFFFTIKVYRVRSSSHTFRQLRWIPIALILLQTILGILTVLSSSSISAEAWGKFEWLAQLHQVIAMLYLLSLVSILYVTRKKSVQLS